MKISAKLAGGHEDRGRRRGCWGGGASAENGFVNRSLYPVYARVRSRSCRRLTISSLRSVCPRPSRRFALGAGTRAASGSRSMGCAPRSSVPARLRAVAARHPERVALLEPTGALTYRELVAGARRVAGVILGDEAGPGGGTVAILSSLDSSRGPGRAGCPRGRTDLHRAGSLAVAGRHAAGSRRCGRRRDLGRRGAPPHGARCGRRTAPRARRWKTSGTAGVPRPARPTSARRRRRPSSTRRGPRGHPAGWCTRIAHCSPKRPSPRIRIASVTPTGSRARRRWPGSPASSRCSARSWSGRARVRSTSPPMASSGSRPGPARRG